MNSNKTSTDAQHSNSTLGRRSVLQKAGALAGAGAITAIAGCSSSSAGTGGGMNSDEEDSTPTPEPDEPIFPVTTSVSEPYHFYQTINEYPTWTDYHGPVWYVDLTFDLAVDIDDWKGTFPSMFPIRVSKNGGNPRYARILHINWDKNWYRVEDKWFLNRSHFIVDGTETEYLVFGDGEYDEPDAGTDYVVYLEDRANQDFHELASFTYGDILPVVNDGASHTEGMPVNRRWQRVPRLLHTRSTASSPQSHNRGC